MTMTDQTRDEAGKFVRAPEPTREDASHAEDVVLAKVMGLEEVPADPKVAHRLPDMPNREEEPEAEPQQDKEPVAPVEDEQTASEESPAKETAAEETVSDPDEDPGFARAWSALERSGFTASELQGMERDDILARGGKRADVLSKDDAAYKELRSLKKDSQSSDTDQEAAPPPDFTERFAPLKEEVGSQVDPLVETITNLHQSLAELRNEVTGLRNGYVQNVEETDRQALLAARGRLRERFPRLGDDEQLLEVKSEMDLLADGPRFSGKGMGVVDDLMLAAVRSLNFHEIDPVAAADSRQKTERAKAQGSPAVQTKSDTPPKEMTPADVEETMLRMKVFGRPDGTQYTDSEILRAVGR